MPDSKQRGGGFSWLWKKWRGQSPFDSEIDTRNRARAEFDRSLRERHPYISDSELDFRWKNGEGEEILAAFIRNQQQHTAQKKAERLTRIYTTVLAIGVLSAIGIPMAESGYAKWAQMREDSRKEEERQKREADKKTNATSASLAGMFWASAVRQCAQIGISDVRQCASHQGLLIQEIGAVESAKLAVKQADEYFDSCAKRFQNEYCNALVERATVLSLKSEK